MEIEDHDPWNEPTHRHPRAQELMPDESLWDCVNELAPFGSDEGADAYREYRQWRRENPNNNLLDCLSWILGGSSDEYNSSLIEQPTVITSDESADEFGYPDAFTLDTTIIATVLGQLVDEGRIDEEAKPFARIAINRQCHPAILEQFNDNATRQERRALLQAVQQVIDAA